MSVDLLSRDHGYASERRSAEAPLRSLSPRNARIGKTDRDYKDRNRGGRIREYETMLGWERKTILVIDVNSLSLVIDGLHFNRWSWEYFGNLLFRLYESTVINYYSCCFSKVIFIPLKLVTFWWPILIRPLKTDLFLLARVFVTDRASIFLETKMRRIEIYRMKPMKIKRILINIIIFHHITLYHEREDR